MTPYDRIYFVIKKIPKGRVATYGQIARLAGLPGNARQVGFALRTLPSSIKVPWHRVINSAGSVSVRAVPNAENEQYQRLKKEGIQFSGAGRVNLRRYQWSPLQ